ncbi:ZIP family metal transporter [Candidatus Microgenomates bacterium]|nr:ZIP family metal transporter [Candidatus Microgenomates bacterium]
MDILSYIIIFTLLGSVVSLIGGALLLTQESFTLKISHFLSAFAAGALLGTAFFDLLPEAFEEKLTGEINIFLWILLGILAFFLLERFIHHHDSPRSTRVEAGQPVVPLIVIGDTVHNFVDGVAIAATFLISIPLGVVTTMAVAAHEIPQEIADFGLMLSRGVKRGKVLWINLLSSLSALVGAVLTFIYRDSLEGLVPIILALTAGFFIYIASANLIPEIHSQENKKVAFWETVCLFMGVVVIYLAIFTLEGAG